MRLTISFLSLLAALVLLSGCGSSDQAAGEAAPAKDSYLAAFPAFQRSTIEFSADGLPDPIESPFDGKQVYPTGKITLDDGAALAFVTIYDGGEPLGEVIGELIAEGKRQDTLKVAESDLGYYQHAILALPVIHVIEEPGDGPADTTSYKISNGKFEQLNK